jgi:uncharacterized protein YjeT (DUF2065 family)
VAPQAARRPRRRPRAADAQPLNTDVLWAALALMLVFEGLFPFLSPGGWRQTFQKLLQLRDGQLRFFGLVSILLGLVSLYFLL